MKILSKSIRAPVFASAAAMLALLGTTACDGSKDTAATNEAADGNVVLPTDESRERHHEQGVAAEMHNQMSAQQGNQMGAAKGGMADDQMGAGGMMDDNMPMGKAPMGDKPMGNSGAAAGDTMAKPDAGKDKPMPMEDDM
jgi:hypothetical protein